MNLLPNIHSFDHVLLVGVVIINVFVAVCVHRDATGLQQKDPAQLKILPPLLWALVCLVGSVPALALYWAAHHSSLGNIVRR